MRMDRRREGIKLVVGVLGAAILLMAVLLLGSAVNPYLEGNDKVQTQNGQENYSLVSSGQTVWDYLETGKEPAADGEGRTWLEQGYEGEGWKSASWTFGSVKGERTDRVANKLPRNLLAFYQEDGTLVPAYYFRTEFEVEDPKAVQKLQGEIQYDDAVIVYLNGEVLYEGNVPEHGYAESLYIKSLMAPFLLRYSMRRASSSSALEACKASTSFRSCSILAIIFLMYCYSVS